MKAATRGDRRYNETQFSYFSGLNDIVRLGLAAFLDVPGPCAVIIEDGVFKKRVIKDFDHLAVAAMLGHSERRPNVFPWDQRHRLAVGKHLRHVLNGNAIVVGAGGLLVLLVGVLLHGVPQYASCKISLQVSLNFTCANLFVERWSKENATSANLS